MQSKHLLLSIISLVFILPCFSQLPVGHYYDADGMPIEGYFDLINYHPQNIIDVSPNALYYESGCYYGQGGERYVGFIKYDNNDFYFTSKLSNQGVILNPNNVKGLRVGVDSFFVAIVPTLQPRHTGAKNQDPVFLQYVALTDDFQFAIHYYNNSDYAVNQLGKEAISKEYCIKEQDKLHWRSIPKNKKQFSDLWLNIFEEDSVIKTKLINKAYSIKDALSLIKICDYQYRLDNNVKIDLDRNWQELSSLDGKIYSGRITDRIDSIWTIKYYKSDEILYAVKYSSFYPNVKNGHFMAFDTNQKLRLRNKFVNNSMISTEIFTSKGEKKYVYVKEKGTSTTKPTLKFIDLAGVSRNELYSDKIIQTRLYDSIRNIEHVKDFKFGKLASSYYDIDGTKIYQMCDPNFKLDLEFLARRAKGYFKNKNFKIASEEGIEGVILTSFLVNSKGIPFKFEILNELHPEVNILYEEFLERSMDDLRFKSYKINSKKVIYEVVIPLRFSFNRFYRKPAYDIYNSYPFWYDNINRMF